MPVQRALLERTALTVGWVRQVLQARKDSRGTQALLALLVQRGLPERWVMLALLVQRDLLDR